MKLKFTLTLGLTLSCFLGMAQSYTIKGNLKGQGNEKIILRGTDGNITVDAINGAFELSGPAGKELKLRLQEPQKI
jgi:hypothetical protein